MIPVMAAAGTTSGAGRLLVALGLTVYAVWAVRYMFSMSVAVGDERWFLLWDDAMISMQYAKNFAAGNGLVWNAGGEAIQGFTNLGVTLIMAALHLLPVPLTIVPLLFQLLNLAILIAILFSVFRISLLLFGNSLWVGYGSAVLVGLYGPLAVWGLQGADFNLLALITLLSVEYLIRARRNDRSPSPWVFVFLGLGIVVRLDFSLVYGTVWLWCVVFAFPRRSLALPGLFIGAGVWLLLMGFNLAYFGDPLPNTFYLKATGTPKGPMLARGFSQVLGMYQGTALLGLLLFGFYGSFLLRRDSHRFFALFLVLILEQFAYLVWVGGDWVVAHTSRYLMVVMPLYIIFLVGGAWEFLSWLQNRGVVAARLASAFFVVQLLVFVWWLNPTASISEWILQDSEPMYRKDGIANVQFGRALCAYTSRDTKVGLFWAGVPPYVCEREYVDLLGRADRHIARKQVHDFRGPGHSKWDWDYVLHEVRPDALQTVQAELLEREDFEKDFCLVRLPSARVIFPVRKTSVSQVLDPEFRLCHPKVYPPCIPCSIADPAPPPSS